MESMKNYSFFYALVIFTIALVAFSTVEYQKKQLSIFILKGSDTSVEAYEMDFSLDDPAPLLKPIALPPEKQRLGGETLRSKDVKALAEFANYFGAWSFVAAIPGAEESWPGYFGGGLHGFFQKNQPESFDNLQPLDRLFFSLIMRTPPPFLLPDSGKPAVTFEPKPVTSPAAGASLISAPVTSIPPAVVRVEILNGCGITNAADWAARRLRGNGIMIVGKDNADNFKYAKTIVRSAAGSPVALEEALDRLGLSKESVEEISNPPASADVVVIVGKDFRKLKERLRDRTYH
jgi:hypothetical protein